jgi:tetratricopeptide (TPR) repeat protein
MALVLLTGLFYTTYRLYHLRTVANLTLAAGKIAVISFLVFSYRGGAFLEPFVVSAVIVFAFAAPLSMLCFDLCTLRKKVKERFGIALSGFLYRNDRSETQKFEENIKYLDDMLRPRIESFSSEEILAEIRVERADTSKNIHRQLAIAARKSDEDDLNGALAAYQTIEKVFNRSPSLYFNIGNVEYDLRDYESAMRDYRRAIDCAGHKDFENDDMAEKLGVIQYNLGNACFMLKRYAKAIEAYKNASASDSSNADALYNLSFCHAMDFEDTGDTEKAVEAFKKLAEDMPDNLHAWYHYGKCLLKMKNVPQAIECFKKVVAEDVVFYEAWYSLAIAYDESGMLTDAVKAYYTSIQIKPDFINAYNNLGVLLSQAGRRGEALKVLKSAARIKPGDTELIFNIGMIYYETGRYEEALGEFLTCVKLQPGDADVLYLASLISMKTGNTQEALSYLERAVLIDPSVGARAAREQEFQSLASRAEYSKLFTY